MTQLRMRSCAIDAAQAVLGLPLCESRVMTERVMCRVQKLHPSPYAIGDNQQLATSR